MLRKLTDIRKQPKSVRERYALYGAGIITAVIVGFWSLSLPAQFDIENLGGDLAIDDEAGGALRAMRDVTDQFASVLEATGETEETTSTSESPAPANANEIDIAGMFATSSANEAGETDTTPSPRTILIATSSRTTSTPAVTETE